MKPLNKRIEFKKLFEQIPVKSERHLTLIALECAQDDTSETMQEVDKFFEDKETAHTTERAVGNLAATAIIAKQFSAVFANASTEKFHEVRGLIWLNLTAKSEDVSDIAQIISQSFEKVSKCAEDLIKMKLGIITSMPLAWNFYLGIPPGESDKGFFIFNENYSAKCPKETDFILFNYFINIKKALQTNQQVLGITKHCKNLPRELRLSYSSSSDTDEVVSNDDEKSSSAEKFAKNPDATDQKPELKKSRFPKRPIFSSAFFLISFCALYAMIKSPLLSKLKMSCHLSKLAFTQLFKRSWHTF